MKIICTPDENNAYPKEFNYKGETIPYDDYLKIIQNKNNEICVKKNEINIQQVEYKE